MKFSNPFLTKMKNSKPVLVIISLFLVVFLSTSHCMVFLPMDGNLIEETCKETPSHDLCVSSLQSDPRSFDADVKGLALIMFDVVKAKATDTLNHINDLLKQTPGAQPLSSCLDVYIVVIQTKIPEASEALTEGDPKFAEQGMNDVGLEADFCESVFVGGSSPLTDLNKTVRDVADVASAIVQHFDMHI